MFDTPVSTLSASLRGLVEAGRGGGPVVIPPELSAHLSETADFLDQMAEVTKALHHARTGHTHG